MSETGGLGIVCDSLLSHGGAKSAAAFHSSLNLNGTLSCARKKTVMKKLMFAAVAGLCSAVMADSIVSSSIVGYMNKEATEGSKQVAYPTMGGMFVSVGSSSTFCLNDITMTTKDSSGNRVDGGGYGALCKLQVINPATSVIDSNGKYLFYGYADGADDSDRGWYNENDEDTLVNPSFPAGTAFLCNFAPSLEVQLTFAGQVLKGDVTIDSVVNEVAYAYPYVVNPFPVDIKLSAITMKTVDKDGNLQDGGGYGAQCKLQRIDPATSVIDPNGKYLFYGYADGADDSDRGWYNENDEDTLIGDSVTIKAGEGFLCNFATSLKPKLIFTNPVK